MKMTSFMTEYAMNGRH